MKETGGWWRWCCAEASRTVQGRSVPDNGAMEPSAEDDLVLSLTLEHLKRNGAWPKLQDIHQWIHQELHLQADVQESARRLAPTPFVGGGYGHLGETFAPPLEVLSRSPEGRRLIECLVDFIKLAREKYVNQQGQPELTSDEMQGRLGVNVETARAVRELMHSVPFVTDGGHSNADGWSVTVAHEITRWEGLVDGADLFRRVAEIRARDAEHLAELTRAQHRMSRLDVEPLIAEPHEVVTRRNRWDQLAGYLETHPAIRILAVLGIPLAIVVAIFTLLRG